MAFAAYVLENAILFFSPGGAFARFLKPHQCVEKSDLLSIFGLLHLLPLPPQTFWSSSLLLAKELWVGSIKSQVESGCYSLFSD